uniref:non-specific serine/threonine protein kinase n=1 Tax=Aegilops tauschii TaxID=37682 RepID=M8C494_AEGTA
MDPRLVAVKEGAIYCANLGSASWNFYDQLGSHVSHLNISYGESDADAGANETLTTAVLGNDGSISFSALPTGSGRSTLPLGIPPDSCDPHKNPTEFQLAQLDSGVGYIGTSFASPDVAKTNITGCKDTCMANCSCVAMFFNQTSGDCFLFDQIGSLQKKAGDRTVLTTFVKIPNHVSGQGGRHTVIIVATVVGPLAFIGVLIYVGLYIYRWTSTQDQEEGYGYLHTMAGAPTRFTYKELQAATNNFSDKLGEGGFGSVYLGTLPDGSHIAVKQLEGVGQGEKEFRSEVTIIGSIHHIHLVKLRGFCTEGVHRLVAYEYMANGSLHRWIFASEEDDAPVLDWDTRFYIALGTAKGLAYLHQDCESKIIHCDIKPENVLLNDNFTAKVSDFGLAKLMSREQSEAFTTLRGTRGYLAPEWITNCAVSDKSDVYSYGMVLLEIISGRRSFNRVEVSEKAHFPPFAFKKMEEGDICTIFDAKLKYDRDDDRMDRAIKVALWCIQEDFHQRPSMSKVVQMLEGVCDVPRPPTCSQTGSMFHVTGHKSSGAIPSAVQLSEAR